MLRVQVGDAGYTDPAGYPVPETKFTGSGAAQIFHDGEVVTGRWVKDGLDDAIALEVGGEEVTLPAGNGGWSSCRPRAGRSRSSADPYGDPPGSVVEQRPDPGQHQHHGALRVVGGLLGVGGERHRRGRGRHRPKSSA